MKPDNILSLPTQPVPYAVLGSPINHSLSPLMQQAAFDSCGIDARYYRIEVDDGGLENAVAKMRSLSFGGWNCTIPNKVRMYELCDVRAESAEQFRAVNTVINDRGKLIGHNTDGLGWSRALRDAFDCSPSELRILLLGTGGAGRAIATQAILEKCPHLLVANRDPARAHELLSHLNAPFSRESSSRRHENLRVVAWKQPDLEAALREVDLVVNATSAGLDPKVPPILSAPMLRPELMVFDTIYGPGCAKLQAEVLTAGAKWSDGLGMLLHQGAAAFSLWTSRDAPLDVMRAALTASLSV